MEAEVVALRADAGGVAAGAGAVPVLCGADTAPEGDAGPVGGAECVLLVPEEGAAAGSVLCMAPSRRISRWEVALMMPTARADSQRPFECASFREVLRSTSPPLRTFIQVPPCRREAAQGVGEQGDADAGGRRDREMGPGGRTTR